MTTRSDLDLVKAVAVRMHDLPPMIEHEEKMRFGYRNCLGPAYDPLHDDAQMAALIKKFRLHVIFNLNDDQLWECYFEGTCGAHTDLNRAICECIASLPATREGEGG